jgi:glycosyltransferase involved in cell wall biosynthesis
MQSHGTAWGEITSKLSVPNPLMWVGILRVIVDTIRYWPENHWPENLYTHIVPIGPEVLKQLSSAPMRWIEQGNPSTLIENGVDELRFRFDSSKRVKVRRELNIPEDAKAVISINRISYQKGCRQALRAMMQVIADTKDLHYIVAGEGPALPALRSTVADAGLSDRVHFVGRIDRNRIPEMLSASDVFLFPSLRQEGLAIAPLEAAANGLRCILSNHIAPRELVCSPVDPRNTSEICAAILAAVAAERSAVSLLPARYSLQVAVERYERLFMELVNSARMQAPSVP